FDETPLSVSGFFDDLDGSLSAPGGSPVGGEEMMPDACMAIPPREEERRDEKPSPKAGKGKAPSGPVVKGAFTGASSVVPVPSRPLELVLDEFGKALARALEELAAGSWPKDLSLLELLREEVLANLALRGVATKATRTRALFESTLVSLFAALRGARGRPTDHVDSLRAASEALAAQCRSELAPLLGSGGSPWEASI
ncbi:MAG: hypothetical protein ACAI25_11930, partial [Planctomycetota bacterium]